MSRIRSLSRRAHAAAIWAAALLAALSLLSPATAEAGSIEIGETRVRTENPDSVTFSTRITSSAGLESAVLEYKVLNPDGNVGGSGRAGISPGSETDATYTLQTRNRERYIPVGSEFVYHWVVTDRDGDVERSSEERYLFLDGRYSWESRSRDSVTVYWYGGNDEAADLALDATADAVNSLEELLQTEVPYPIRVMVWRSESEGQAAMRPRGSTFDELVVTGGQRVAPDLLLVFTPNVDVIRHEAAHIVTHVAGDGPFASIPSWLDEGTAVYMQNRPGAGYESAVQFAIQNNSPFSLRSMQSPSNNPGQVNQFYGQSWSTVRFMIDEFGEERFAEVFRQVREGSRIDGALTEVYGVDQDGLYNLWRETNGLEPIEVSERSGGSSAPAAEATRAPLSIPQGRGSASGGATTSTGATDDPGGSTTDGDTPAEAPATESVSNTAAAAIVAGAAVLLAVLLGSAGVYLARRRS